MTETWQGTDRARRCAAFLALPAPPPSTAEVDGVDRLTLEEIRAELERLVELRFIISQLSPVDEARYRLLAERERALLLEAAS